jgi:hypothetical protein
MAQRNSEYERIVNDKYCTPAWVTRVLLPHIPIGITSVWEPAAGDCHIADVLRTGMRRVFTSDIEAGTDFLRTTKAPDTCKAIITNPPFKIARAFIDHALSLMEPREGFVAMLLPIDFDSAKTRQDLFGRPSLFSRKIVLIDRIVFFDRPGAAPSTNHAWFIWSHLHNRHEAPKIFYGGKNESNVGSYMESSFI